MLASHGQRFPLYEGQNIELLPIWLIYYRWYMPVSFPGFAITKYQKSAAFVLGHVAGGIGG